MIVIIIAIIVGLAFFNIGSYTSTETTKVADGNSCKSVHSVDAVKVDNNYAVEAITFFDSYLNLCKKHNVLGVCSLLYTGEEKGFINTKLECIITAIDNKHADEEFEMIKLAWVQIRNDEMKSGDYPSAVLAGDKYIKNYFGCENLHYAFTEADEYKFENGQVIMSVERPIYTFGGAQWQPTINFIKQELQKKWGTATITAGKGRIVVHL